MRYVHLAHNIHTLIHLFAISTPLCAEADKTAVQQSLEAKKDDLVQNYVQEQRKLYSELLSEVRQP